MSKFAFPHQVIGEYGARNPKPGMLLEDYFASKALQALILKQDHIESNLIAKDAYEHAMAMMKEREKLRQEGKI